MSKKKPKVHLRVNGLYICNVNRRWGSSQITSVKCADYVTCKNCLRVVSRKRIVSSSDDAANVEMYGMTTTAGKETS